MDYSDDGPGPPANTQNGFNVKEGMDAERLRAMAGDALHDAEDYLKRARELVARYPGYSVAGAVAAGFLFARFVARRR